MEKDKLNNIVMIIDDFEIDRFITSHIIKQNKFAKEILQFSNGKDALIYLNQNEYNMKMLPDYIFLDIYMPEMSGFEFLISYDKLSHIIKMHCKVFLISSSTDAVDRIRADLDKNVNKFQLKPITDEFLKTIAKEAIARLS